MNIKEMISEWRRGCCCGPTNPAHCVECTTALIDAIEKDCLKSNKDRVIEAAKKVLMSPNSSKAAKTANGSALSQRQKRSIYAHNMRMFHRE